MQKITQNIITELRVIQASFTDSIKTIFSDRGAILIILIAAVFYPIIYSIAYSKEVVSDIPTAVVDNDNTNLSRQWTKMLDATPAMQVYKKTGDIIKAEELYWENEVKAVVLIPDGFEKNILKGKQATVSLYADASNFLLYKESLKNTLSATGTLSAGVELKKYLSKTSRPELAVTMIQPIQTNTYNLFNPAGLYGSFVMPGLMLLIIQQTLLVGIGLIGGAGRERKRNTLADYGFSFADHAFATITGKSLAYFAIGIFNIMCGTILAYHWFNFPDKASYVNVLVLSVPFLLAVVFMGMTLSLVFKHREHAIITLVFLSPIVLFVSGLSWPVESIPTALHWLFNIFPSNYAIPAYIRIRTMGVDIADVRGEMVALIIQMIVYFFIAGFSFKWALKRNKTV